jgi:hypothetical protein
MSGVKMVVLTLFAALQAAALLHAHRQCERECCIAVELHNSQHVGDMWVTVQRAARCKQAA